MSPYEAESEAALTKQSPLGPLLEPEEIADAVVFLASPASEAIDGPVLVIAGARDPGVGSLPALQAAPSHHQL